MVNSDNIYNIKDYITDEEQDNIFIVDNPTFTYEKSSLYINDNNQLVTNMRYATELLGNRPQASSDTSIKQIKFNKFLNLRRGGDSKVQATLLDLIYQSNIVVYLGSGEAKWLENKFTDNRRLFIFIDTVKSECVNPELFIKGIYNEFTKDDILGKITDYIMSRITTIRPNNKGKFNILLISDIRTPFSSALKVSQKKTWEESIRQDHVIQANFIYNLTNLLVLRFKIIQIKDIDGIHISEKRVNITSHLKIRPLYSLKGRNNCINGFKGKIRLQPFSTINSTEIRVVSSKQNILQGIIKLDSKIINRIAMRWNELRLRLGESESDIVLFRNYVMLITERVNTEFYNTCNSTRLAALYSMSNSNNKPPLLLLKQLEGFKPLTRVVTYPYVKMGTTDISTYDSDLRNYQDHNITFSEEIKLFNNKLVVMPLWEYFVSNNYISEQSIKNVIIFPSLDELEQKNDRINQSIKLVSSIIRLKGKHLDMYKLRRETALSLINGYGEIAYAKIVSIIGAGDKLFFKDLEIKVSGHLIYAIIGSCIGIPIGIKRYTTQIITNLGNPSRTQDTYGILQGVYTWHTLL